MKRTAGFTIVELMITLVIATILATIAGPPLISLIQNGRGFSGANDLHSLLTFARGQAVTRQQPVVVCSWAADGSGCANDKKWSSRQIQAFVDSNGDGVYDKTESKLKAIGPFADQDILYSSRVSYGFTAQGRASGLNNGYVLYCPGSASSDFNRRVSVASSGRISVAKKKSDPSVGNCP